MTLQVVMPMGGLGQRFRNAGFTTPKPLIPVDGEPMFLRALRSFDPVDDDITLTIVIRKDDDEASGIGALIREARPHARVVVIDRLTRGAAETAYAALDGLDLDDPLVVMDCDIAFRSDEFFGLIRDRADLDGLLLTFRSQDPRYSYVEVDERGNARRAVEKVVISEHAIMGSYFFRRASDFSSIAETLIRGGAPEGVAELYMSLAVNQLIADGGTVGVSEGDFFCFGTPEELAAFERTGLPVNLQ